MDTLLAMGRRAIRGRPLFQADKEHIHHRLMDRGLSHRQAVLVLYGFCIVLGAAALVLTYANSGQAALLLVVLAVVAFVFLRTLGYVRFDQMPAAGADRKRNRAMRAALQPLGRRLKQLRAVDEMWPLVIEAGKVLGAVTVDLRVDLLGATESASTATYSHGDDLGGRRPPARFDSSSSCPAAKPPSASWCWGGTTDARPSIATPRSPPRSSATISAKRWTS